MSTHSIHLQDKKKENLPKLSVYRIWRKSLRTQEHVRLIHDKRAIGVRVTEVLLYCGYSLEPPWRGGSNECPQSMFLSRNKKNNIYLCKP